MKKQVISWGLAGLMVVSPLAYAEKMEAWTSQEIQEGPRLEARTIESQDKGRIEIRIPEILGLEDQVFQKTINDRIRKQVEDNLELFTNNNKDEESEFLVDYDLKSQGQILSLVVTNYEIYREDANGQTRRYFYNIDLKNKRELEIKDLFQEGQDYKGLINKQIREEIAKNPGAYFQEENSFKFIDQDQDFYLDKRGNLVVAFPTYKIGPRSTGSPEFTVELDRIKDMLRKEYIQGPVVFKKSLASPNKNFQLDYPLVEGLGNKQLEDELNQVFLRRAQEQVAKLKEAGEDLAGDSQLILGFRSWHQGAILSIEEEAYSYRAGAAHGSQARKLTNIDLEEGKILGLEDLFKDPAYKEAINKEVRRQIGLEEEKYFPLDDGTGFRTIREDQDFYLDEMGNLVLNFHDYEIAPHSSGLISLKISSSYLDEYLRDQYKYGLTQEDRLVLNGQDLALDSPLMVGDQLMIPLAQVLEGAGFQLEWQEETGEVLVARDQLSSRLSLRENKYSLNKAILQLDQGAKSLEGKAYVPGDYLRALGGEVFIEKGILNIKL